MGIRRELESRFPLSRFQGEAHLDQVNVGVIDKDDVPTGPLDLETKSLVQGLGARVVRHYFELDLPKVRVFSPTDCSLTRNDA